MEQSNLSNLKNLTKNSIFLLLRSYQKAINYNTIVSVTDNKGEIVYVNNKFCEISRYTRKELIGSDHKIINSKTHPSTFFSDLWKTISRGKVWRGEIKNRDKDGNAYWVDTVIIPIKLNQEIFYLSLRTLITERKELEETRKEYISSLEKLIHMTSHELRAPVCSLLGLTEIDLYNVPEEDFRTAVEYIYTSAKRLDLEIIKLSEKLENLKRSYRLKD